MCIYDIAVLSRVVFKENLKDREIVVCRAEGNIDIIDETFLRPGIPDGSVEGICAADPVVLVIVDIKSGKSGDDQEHEDCGNPSATCSLLHPLHPPLCQKTRTVQFKVYHRQPGKS